MGLGEEESSCWVSSNIYLCTMATVPIVPAVGCAITKEGCWRLTKPFCLVGCSVPICTGCSLAAVNMRYKNLHAWAHSLMSRHVLQPRPAAPQLPAIFLQVPASDQSAKPSALPMSCTCTSLSTQRGQLDAPSETHLFIGGFSPIILEK